MVRRILLQFAFALLSLAIPAFAQNPIQPTGSHVIYSDGSAFFYYSFTNPHTGASANLTLEIWCKAADPTATFVNAGVYQTIPLTASCLMPPTVGTVTITTGGTVEENGMTFTLEPGSYEVFRHCLRTCNEYIGNVNMPLTVN